MSDSINVFVSYSWGVEKDTQIVEDLDSLCQQRGINLIQDNKTLKHGDFIKKFMDELSKGEHVITVFSKPYFESKWCMYELLCIYQPGDFGQRTHPVIADDCDLKDQDYRLKLVDFWRERFELTQDKLKKYDTLTVQSEHRHVELYRDIYQNINKLVNFAADRVTHSLTELQEQNYAQLLDRIKPVSQLSPGKTETQDKVASAIQLDQDFLKEVQASLGSLKQSSKLYHDKLVKQCAVPLKEANDLPGYLIKQCLEGHFAKIVRNMETTFVSCLKELDANNSWEINAVLQAAEDLISKLVLFNVKNEWIEEYYSKSALAIEPKYMLPDLNLTAIEVVASRQTQTIPRFQASGKGMRDINIDKVFTLEIGIKHGIDTYLKLLHSSILGNQFNDGMDRNELIQDIKDTIAYRKKHTDIALRKRYFILIPSDESASLANKELQLELARLLAPELEWITLKMGTREQVFLITDGELKTAIREFFTTLANFNPKNSGRT